MLIPRLSLLALKTTDSFCFLTNYSDENIATLSCFGEFKLTNTKKLLSNEDNIGKMGGECKGVKLDLFKFKCRRKICDEVDRCLV